METGTSVPSSNHFRSYVDSTSKRHQKINPAIHIYMDRINNGLVFKVKDGYKLELQTPVTMKLLGCTKELIYRSKNEENVPGLKVVEVVLTQYNLVDDHISKTLRYYLFLHPINLICYLLFVKWLFVKC